MRPVKRRHANPVAGQNQTAALAIPKSEGKLTVKLRKEVSAEGLPEVQNRLGITAGAQRLYLSFQLPAQFRVIEEMAIQHQGCGLLLGKKRLS